MKTRWRLSEPSGSRPSFRNGRTLDSFFRPARPLSDVLYGYLATELVAGTRIETMIVGAGMPAGTMYMAAAATIVSLTCVAAPMFRNKVHNLAGTRLIDVVLIRCCQRFSDILPMSVDVTLARGRRVAIDVHDLALYRHDDGDLWLVPHGFHGAIRFGTDGLELHLVPPYPTLVERARGIYRSTSELAMLLYPKRTDW